jgi:hypothetical protein
MMVGCELAVVNIGLGLTLLLGLPTRTAAASFDPIKNLAPIHVWGWLFVTTGVVAIAAQLWQRYLAVSTAHAVAGMSCLFWTFAFVTGLNNPAASGTGIWAYLGLGLTHLIVAATARTP